MNYFSKSNNYYICCLKVYIELLQFEPEPSHEVKPFALSTENNQKTTICLDATLRMFYTLLRVTGIWNLLSSSDAAKPIANDNVGEDFMS